MSLIENLEQDGWEAFLRDTFDYTLYVLSEDRFRSVGSSVDDLRSWMAAGGVPLVLRHLEEGMERRRLPAERCAGIRRCMGELVEAHRARLLNLMAREIIPGSAQDCLAACGLSRAEFDGIIERLARGERPFEEWMLAHGYSQHAIAAIYRDIDAWLLETTQRADARSLH
jgi:hypothetical protein